MTRAVLLSCLPWLVTLVVLVVLLRLMVRLEGARSDLRRLRSLHRDQGGAAQSLSFVLTVPVFIMIMLLIVQVSQLMIGAVVVHYAAYAAARAAGVWIPACLGDERENCISSYAPDPEANDQVSPILDASDPHYGPAEGGVTYLVQPDGPKYAKIKAAAVLALAPISPSRDLEFTPATDIDIAPMVAALPQVYDAMTGDSSKQNPRIPQRLQNKVAYAAAFTKVEIRFFHKNDYPEPPLAPYPWLVDSGIVKFDDQHIEPYKYPDEFQFNELGWQDPITVTVKHELALLPGLGRLLTRFVASPDGKPDPVAEKIKKQGTVYTYPLKAEAVIGNEGEKSVVPYDYSVPIY